MHRAPIGFVDPYQDRPRAHAASPVEELMASFAGHEKRERETLGDYQETVKRHDSPLVKFLLQLVIADEEKHHEIIRKVVSSLAADLSWDSAAASMPKLGTLAAADRVELLRLTEELIAEERQGISDYKTLAKQSKGYHGGLLELLTGMIIHDSKKHLMILKFLKRCLKEIA